MKDLTSYINKQIKISKRMMTASEKLLIKVAQAIDRIPIDGEEPVPIADIHKLTQILDLLLKQANENFEKGNAVEKVIETLRSRM